MGDQGRFLDSLAQHCEAVICFLHSPTAGEMPFMNYAIQSPIVQWVDIGAHVSLGKRVLRAGVYPRLIQERAKDMDVLLLRAPSPLLPAIAGVLDHTPIALLVIGDYTAGTRYLKKNWLIRAGVQVWAAWNKRRQLRIAERALTFVNSRQIYEELRPRVTHLHEIHTSTLTGDDFYEREDTCSRQPIRLLYTGRIDPAKGIYQLVESVGQLVAAGENVVLDLVGKPEKDPHILDELRRLAADQGIAERVVFHGYKSLGSELFRYYQEADIYVLPSWHEGFPRVLWEALAHSLPVVTTRVGGIPTILRDRETALLIQPRSCAEITQAVRTLIRDSSLRRKLIQQGRALARKNTLEAATQEMVTQLNRWLDGK
jgi:glycosyltransferase involved in cell wall biosynthesis